MVLLLISLSNNILMLTQAGLHWCNFNCAQDNAFNYDKGVLAEILEPIMGKGLIPADLETWKPRRRAIVPAFHKAYLEAMVAMFGACTQETIRSLHALTAAGQVLRSALTFGDKSILARS